MAARRGRPRKIATLEAAKKHLQDIIGEDSEFIGVNWENFRNYEQLKNCYSITIRVMSLNTLISVMEDSRVKKVFYHPSVAPPGAGMTTLALRYKLYVQYK